MASFLLSMLNMLTIKYSTAQGYVGSVNQWHLDCLGGLGSPLADVMDWGRFCNACMVQHWVDASVESHLMFPFQYMVRTLLCLDRSNRLDCALALMMLLMYFTMARSQSPLPKSRSSFDPKHHIRRCDVRMALGRNDAMEWNLGVVKNSTAKQKAAGLDNKDNWKPVGICSGVLNIFMWFNAYCALSSWESPDSPFFYDDKGVLTYVFMLNYMRNAMAGCPEMTWAIAKMYGFHGLRVLGFNCARASTGDEVAILQGGWLSGAWQTYTRAQIDAIVQAAKDGANYAASHALPSLPLDATPVPLRSIPADSAYVPSTRPFPAPRVAPTPPAGAPYHPTPPVVAPSSNEAPPLVDDYTFSLSDLVVSTKDYPSDGSSDSLDGLPTSSVAVEKTTHTGRKYTIHLWKGRRFTSLPMLRAAYAAAKAGKSDFFSALSNFGYTRLGSSS